MILEVKGCETCTHLCCAGVAWHDVRIRDDRRRRERRNAITQERLESARPLQRVGVMDSHLQPPSGSLPSGPVTFGAGGSGDPWGKPRHIRRLSEVSEVAQLCPTLYNPMDCNLLCSSVHGIFQARVLEGIAISSSRGSS